MTLEETKTAHAEQVADILKTLRPDLTPGQVRKIQEEAAAAINDWQIAPINRYVNETVVSGLIMVKPELTRKIPSKATVQAAREADYMKTFAVDRVPADIKMNIAREIANSDEDGLLAMAPFETVKHVEERPATELQKLETCQPQTDKERDDAWIKSTFGMEAATLLPSKRRDYLAQRDKQSSPQSLQRDALAVDAFAVKKELTARDRMTLHRAQQNLKRA